MINVCDVCVVFPGSKCLCCFPKNGLREFPMFSKVGSERQSGGIKTHIKDKNNSDWFKSISIQYTILITIYWPWTFKNLQTVESWWCRRSRLQNMACSQVHMAEKYHMAMRQGKSFLSTVPVHLMLLVLKKAKLTWDSNCRPLPSASLEEALGMRYCFLARWCGMWHRLSKNTQTKIMLGGGFNPVGTH